MARKKRNKSLSKWDPFMHDMMSFKKSLDDMFTDFFSNNPISTKLPSLWKGRLGLWRPEVDMYETDNQVIVKANVPGCDKKDIKVRIDDNILTIIGEKTEEKEVKKKDFYQKEQHTGSFQRSVSLPLYADADKADATCEKGVIKVAFPKKETEGAKGKSIDVK